MPPPFASLTRLYTARDNLKHLLASAPDKPLTEAESAFAGRLKEYERRFDAAMDDDLNTADAIGAIFELVKDANVTLSAESARGAVEAALASLKALCDVLGLVQREEDALPEEIQRMADERAAAARRRTGSAPTSCGTRSRPRDTSSRIPARDRRFARAYNL